MTNDSSSSRVLAYAPAIILMILIFVMSSRSSIPRSPAISSELTAFLGHLIVYGLLAILLLRGLELDIRNAGWRSITAWIVATLYGISDEIHQLFVPGRYATLFDVLTDSAGAFIGVLAYALFIQLRQRGRVIAR